MINVKERFQASDRRTGDNVAGPVCEHLEIETFASNGDFVDSYCTSHHMYLPNSLAAKMYCCTKHGVLNLCWFELQK